MRRLFLPLLCLVLSSPCRAEFGDEAERETRVYKALADIVSNRDELLKKFAVVVHGEAVAFRGEERLTATPVINARIVDRRRSFDLRAGYLVVTDAGPQFEAGRLTLRQKDQHRAIANNPVLDSLVTKPKDMSLSQWHREHPVMGGADPFDDCFAGASSFSAVNYQAIENGVLGRFKLTGTEEAVGRRLMTHWEFKHGNIVDWKVRIEFDASLDMMPVRVQIKNHALENDFQDTRIHWRKHDDLLLPHRIELAYGSMSSKTDVSECTLRCFWLVGDEVTDEMFSGDRSLTALLDHFKVPRSRLENGKTVPLVHKYPDDLYGKTRSKPNSRGQGS